MEEKDKENLLILAREAIKTHFKRQEPDINNVLHLENKQGVFVTLHKNKDLRGCIGYPEPIMPLYKAVIEAARGAAINDPRFPVVTPDELRVIDIEISVLSVPKELKVDPSEYSKNVEIGVDGLIIRGPSGSGLLLPQVATEQNFTQAQFLNCVCQKAGLSFNAWEDSENKIFTFQAEIFSEKEILE